MRTLQKRIIPAVVVGGVAALWISACSDHRILTLLFDGVPPEQGAEASASPVETPPTGDGGVEQSLPPPAAFVRLDPGSPKALTISSNHASFATKCGNCHEPNAPVADNKCLVCHNDNIHQSGIPMTVACGTCHAEHGGRSADLTRMPSRNCMECHSESPFEQMHPEFHLVADAAAARQAKEATGLDMPHSVHLTARVPEGPREGQMVVCLDCHRLDPARPDTFEPVRFDTICGQCHGVEPHKQAPETSWNDLRAKLPEGPNRVAPLLSAPRWRQFVASAGDAAEVEALQAARDALIEDGVEECFRCHSFAERSTGRRTVLTVPPTGYREHWFDSLRFKHSAHFFVECQTCHAVGTDPDQETGRLMLPGVATCAQCHHDGGASNDCSTCHTFHTRSERQPVGGDRAARVRGLLELSPAQP